MTLFNSVKGKAGEATAPETVVQLFTKAPIKGNVKTRLEPVLSQDEILQLYKGLIEQRVKQLGDAPFCQLNLWVADEAGHRFFRTLQQHHDIQVHSQQGLDLGERMYHAVRSGLQCHQKVILLGGDCVSVDLDYLQQAVSALDASPVVIGPAEDGGYVLLGTRIDNPAMFLNVDWGTERVFSQTVSQLEQQGLPHKRLATRWDLDRPEDFERFKAMAGL